MIVLDTHALVWSMSSPPHTPARTRRVLDATVARGDAVRVSAIGVWEIAMLVEPQRLELTMPADEWIAHAEAVPWLSLVAVDNRVALRAVHLADFPHRDSADRIIVATALVSGATLVTADARIRAYCPGERCGTRRTPISLRRGTARCWAHHPCHSPRPRRSRARRPPERIAEAGEVPRAR